MAGGTRVHDVEDNLANALAEYHKKPNAVKQLANGYSFFNKIDGG